MTHDELIEAVARAIGGFSEDDWSVLADWYRDIFRDYARAAIREIAPAVLDEAAGWADNFADMNAGSSRADIHAACITARDIANTIRALKQGYE